MPAQLKTPRRTLARTWLVIGALAFVIAAGLVYLLSAKPVVIPTFTKTPSETTQETPATTEEEQGSYVVYSELAFQQASSNGRRVLFFHAGWCPQCRALEKDITEQGVPGGMTIFKVDYDSANDLKNRYGVTLQTTIVEVDAQGALIKKHVAYSQPSLSAILDVNGR